MSFVNARRGWSVGTSGAILATTDGGATRKEQRSGTTQGLNGVAFANTRDGWVVSGDAAFGYQSGLILVTTDSGATWKKQVPDTGWVNAVALAKCLARVGG